MSTTRVPVEHRLLGLDRRTIAPTLWVLALVLLWSTIVPFIDRHVSYDVEVEPGTVLDVGSGVTIVPPPYWEIDPQTALTEGSLVVHHSGVTVTVTVGVFDGELSDLMASANDALDVDRITSAQTSITTSSGSVGLIEAFQSGNAHGFIAVFAEDGVGVEIEAIGPEPQIHRFESEIDDMVVSLEFGGAS